MQKAPLKWVRSKHPWDLGLDTKAPHLSNSDEALLLSALDGAYETLRKWIQAGYAGLCSDELYIFARGSFIIHRLEGCNYLVGTVGIEQLISHLRYEAGPILNDAIHNLGASKAGDLPTWPTRNKKRRQREHFRKRYEPSDVSKDNDA